MLITIDGRRIRANSQYKQMLAALYTMLDRFHGFDTTTTQEAQA